MAADSDSKIAWHRAQLRKNRETLKNFEIAKFIAGEIAGSRQNGAHQRAVADLKRKIAESEQVIATHDRQSRRPRATDFRSLASVPWSRWNGLGT